MFSAPDTSPGKHQTLLKNVDVRRFREVFFPSRCFAAGHFVASPLHCWTPNIWKHLELQTELVHVQKYSRRHSSYRGHICDQALTSWLKSWDCLHPRYLPPHDAMRCCQCFMNGWRPSAWRFPPFPPSSFCFLWPEWRVCCGLVVLVQWLLPHWADFQVTSKHLYLVPPSGSGFFAVLMGLICSFHTDVSPPERFDGVVSSNTCWTHC